MKDDVEYCDVTPDISMMPKVGRTGYTPSQSSAEMIDNSIDEMVENIKLKVIIKLLENEVVFIDNAKGMTKEELIVAMTLAKETKGPNELGIYGIGLKASATSLGKYFEVITVKKGSNEAWRTWYNEEEWFNRGEWKFPRVKVPIPQELKDICNGEIHGTVIRIKKLNYKIGNKITSIRGDVGRRFSPYINKNIMEVQVNEKVCKPIMPNIVKGTKKDINIKTNFGKITGWIGLMESSSQTNQYGFNTFRHDRMITCYEKFGFKPHPTVARITGDLHLNHVPVTTNKRGWETTSALYEEAEALVSEDIKDVVAKSKKKSVEKKLSANDRNELELHKESLSIAVTCQDLKLYTLPEKAISTPTKPPSISEIEVKPTEQITNEPVTKETILPEEIKVIKAEVEVEKRVRTDPPQNPGSREPTGTGSKRNPIITIIRDRNVRTKLVVKGKQFDYKHELKKLGKDGPICSSNFDKKTMILEIFINSDFPVFNVTKDKPYYIFHQIVEAVSNLMVEESNADWSEYEEIRRVLLRESGKYRMKMMT